MNHLDKIVRRAAADALNRAARTIDADAGLDRIRQEGLHPYEKDSRTLARWLAAVGAAALVAMLVGYLVVESGRDRNSSIVPAVDTPASTPEPATTTATSTATSATSSSLEPERKEPGSLRVTQHQISCCYTEGQVSFLIIRDAAGNEVTNRMFQAINPILPIVDVQLTPGSYEVESYQRPCSGNCDTLDEPANHCVVPIEVPAGTSVYMTATFEPGPTACTLVPTETALESPVPDEFALREPFDDCGLDFSMESTTGPSRARTCFADANTNGRSAELAAYEAGTIPDTPDYFVYRTHPDRTIEVFVPNLGRTTDGPWRRFKCAGLEPNDAEGFTLVGCTEPTAITPTP